MQPAHVGGAALTQRRVSCVHREAQRRHLQGLRFYLSGCLARTVNTALDWKQKSCNVGRRPKPPQLSPRPQAATTSVIAYGAHVINMRPPGQLTLGPTPPPRRQGPGTLLCASSQRAPLRLNLRLDASPRAQLSWQALLVVITVRRLHLQPQTPGFFRRPLAAGRDPREMPRC